MYDVIVIGMGVAGSFCSLNLDENLKVLAIEKNHAILKKFLLTGGARNSNIANVSSVNEIIKNNTMQDGKFLYSCLTNFSGYDILKFLDQNNIKYENRMENPNRYYLIDGNIHFRDFVYDKLKANKNLNLNLNESFERIIIEEQQIVVFTNKARYTTKKLVFSTGGASYPNTGSDGFIQKICGKNNWKTKPYIAIGNNLNLKINVFKNQAGTSLSKVKLTIKKDQKIIHHEIGDLMITHHGIGGPVARRVSHYFENKELNLTLFISFIDEKVVRNELKAKKVKFLKYCFDAIPKKFKWSLFDLIQIDPHLELANLSKKQIEKIVDVFCNFKLENLTSHGIKTAIAVAGGIDVKQLDPKTMCLNQGNQNIYFIGEVLSTGMLTGGYNITMCCSTAYCAALDINKKIV